MRLGEAYVEIKADKKHLVAGVKDAQKRVVRASTKMQERFDTVNMRKASTSVNAFAKRMAQISAAMISAFTVIAINKFAQSVIRAGTQFESTMAVVKGVSKATTKQFEELTAIARKMGETTEWTATQSAEALQFLSMAGFEVDKSIKALPKVLDLATAGNIGLGRAADIASNALTAMRLPVEQLGRVNDVFVETISSANTNMEMMAESFKYAAPVAAGFGLEIEELSAMIGILGNAGIQGSMAGTQLAMAFTEARRVFEYYSVSTKKADGSTKGLIDAIQLLGERGAKAEEIMQIFGQRSGRAMLNLVAIGAPAIKEFTEQLKNSEGAAQTLATTMRDTLGGSWKILNSVIEGIKLDFFYRYEDSIRNIVDITAEWLSKNKDLIVQRISTFVDMATKSFNFLFEAVESVWVVLSSVPKGIIEFFVSLDDQIRTATDSIEAMNEEIEEMKSPPETMWSSFLGFMTRWGKDIVSIFVFLGKTTGNMIGAIVSDFVSLFNSVGSGIWHFMKSVFTLNKKEFEKSIEDLKKVPQTFFDELNTTWEAFRSSTRANWNQMLVDMQVAVDKIEIIMPTVEIKYPVKDKEAFQIPVEIVPPPLEKMSDFYNKLKEMEERAQEISKEGFGDASNAKREILEQFMDDYQESQLNNFDLELRTLDEQYLAYEKHVTDKQMLNEWYASEYNRIKAQQILDESVLLGDLAKTWGITQDEISKGSVNAWKDVSKALTNASKQLSKYFTDVITGTMTAKEAIKKFGEYLLRTVIEVLVQIGVQKLILAALGKSIQAAETTATIGAMAAVSASAAPAAAMLSMATFGTSATAGTAAYLMGLSTSTAASLASIAAFDAIAAGGAPSYDKGGVSTEPGMYYAGVPEAHIPLEDGSVPVKFEDIKSEEMPPIHITLELDGEVLSEVLYDMTKDGSQMIHTRGITEI